MKYLDYKTTYSSWRHMKYRCTSEKYSGHKNYIDRGITICDRWSGKDGFDNFLKDMGERPEYKTLDRINNDGNYEPSNCRWATWSEQQKNRRWSKPNVIYVCQFDGCNNKHHAKSLCHYHYQKSKRDYERSIFNNINRSESPLTLESSTHG